MTRRVISELTVSMTVEAKLAGHGIDVGEAIEVLWEGPAFFRDKVEGRDLMIGRTAGGRMLTIRIEAMEDDRTIYAVVTGWPATKAERTAWERVKGRRR